MKLADLRDRMTESEFQGMIVDLARARGWLVHHDRRDDLGIGGDAGFPDLVLARRGVIIIAEIKSARGRVTRPQWAWIDALTPPAWPSPVYVAVWRPADWPDIEELLT